MAQIFTPYRCIGLVCDHVPPVVRYHPGHKEFYATTVAERKLLTYKLSNAGLKAVSDQFPEDVTCLAAHKGQLLAGGAAGTIYKVENGARLHAAVQAPGGSAVQHLCAFGNALVAVTADNCLHTWWLEAGIKVGRLIGSVAMDADTLGISCVLHPHLFTNKIVLGSRQGHLQLWNVQRMQLVHAFEMLNSGITCLAQAPAEGVVAVGTHCGMVLLLQLKCGTVLMRFTQEFGEVAGVTFRTDGSPVMLTSSPLGHVTLWHLKDKRVCGIVQAAHAGQIAGIVCLHAQPMLLTTGRDNCLKVWLFDRPDELPRLLHVRAGHSGQPNHLLFYDQDVVSAADDKSVRLFSLKHERLHRSFGTAKLNNSMGIQPPVQLAAETARHGDWCTVAARHRNSRTVTQWDARVGSQGSKRLEPQWMLAAEAQYKTVTATALHITACCNYCLIGYSSGHVTRFNAQSGREWKRRFEGILSDSVVGIFADAYNRLVIGVAADCSLNVWSFRKGQLLVRRDLGPGSAACCAQHRLAGLLAIGRADSKVLLLQPGASASSGQPIRMFDASDREAAAPNCVQFSPDARWLLAVYGPNLYTYSVLHNRLLSVLTCHRSITAIAMSPAADLLVTAHEKCLGFQVWVNTTLFRPLSQMSTEAANGETVGSFNGDSLSDKGLVCLSGLPPSRWQCLEKLDEIKARNKPLEAPVVAKQAPFFLPSASNGDAKARDEEEEEGREVEIKGEGETRAKLLTLSEFSRQLLLAAAEEGDQDQERRQRLISCVQHLESMGPTAIDCEIRDLAEEAWPAFLKVIAACLVLGQHFDTAQAYLATFLKYHSLELSGQAACVAQLEQLQLAQRQVWGRIQSRFQESDCLLTYIRDGVVGNAV